MAYTSTPRQDINFATVASGSSRNFTSTPLPGSLLLAFVFNETDTTQPVVTDTNGNWQLTYDGTDGTIGAGLWLFARVAAASQPAAVTVTKSGDTFAVALHEWPGGYTILGLDTLDEAATQNQNTQGTSSAGPSITTTLATNLIITACGVSGAVTSPSVSGSGFTTVDDSGPSGAIVAMTSYQVPGATGTFAPVFSWTTARRSIQWTVGLKAEPTPSGSMTLTGTTLPTGTAAGTMSLGGAATKVTTLFEPDNAAPFMRLPFVPARPRSLFAGPAAGVMTLSGGNTTSVGSGGGTMAMIGNVPAQGTSAGVMSLTGGAIGSPQVKGIPAAGVMTMAGAGLMSSPTTGFMQLVGTCFGTSYIPPHTFTPPIVADDPQYDMDADALQIQLMRHFKPHARGVNVFKLSNGAYVQDTPTSENANAGVPYPWDPFHTDDVPGLIWRGTSWDGTVQTVVQDPYIEFVYYGGHDPYVISEEEYEDLLAAGYADCLT